MKKFILLVLLALCFNLVGAEKYILKERENYLCDEGSAINSIIRGQVVCVPASYNITTNVTGGNGTSDGNNYTTGIAFTGTSTKTLTLQRLGLSDLTAGFSDIDTWNTTAQMLSATKIYEEIGYLWNMTIAYFTGDGKAYIQSFNITPDDSGFDSVGINSLITAYGSDNTHKLPCGVFLLNQTINLNAQRTELKGSGRCTILKVADYANITPITFSADYTSIKDLTIDGNNNTQSNNNGGTTSGWNVDFTTVENVKIANVSGTCIFANGGTNQKFINNELINCGDSRSDHTSYGACIAINTAPRTLIDNNLCDGFFMDGGIFTAESSTGSGNLMENVQITNNRIRNGHTDQASGIHLYKGRHFLVSGNIIYEDVVTYNTDATFQGINGIFTGTTTEDIYVSGNHINATGNGIEINGENSFVIGNKINGKANGSGSRGQDGQGIYLAGNNTVAVGNTILEANKHGIMIEAGNNVGYYIADNYIFKTQNDGIVFYSGSPATVDYVIITGNVILEAGENGIDEDGSVTITNFSLFDNIIEKSGLSPISSNILSLNMNYVEHQSPLNVSRLSIASLNSVSCDVKAYSTNGTLYCGTDATGSGGDGNNFTTSFGISDGSTKYWSLNRSGMIELNGSFSDIDTDTDDQRLDEVGNPLANKFFNMDVFNLTFYGLENEFFKIQANNTQHAMVLERVDNGNLHLSFNNLATGNALADGLDVGIEADGTARIRQQENLPLEFYTNNIEYLILQADGNLNVTNGGNFTANNIFGFLNYSYILNAPVFIDTNDTGLYYTKSEVNTQNSSIWNSINLKLDATDQRYNDTSLINGVNTSANILALGFITDGNTGWDNTYGFASQGNISTQNTTIWTYINAKWNLSDAQTQNSSYFSTFLTSIPYQNTAGGWTNDSLFTNTTRWVNANNNITLGYDESTKALYFYEDGSYIGEGLYWVDSSDEFQITDDIQIWNNIVSDADIMTSGSGDDLWLGTETQASSLFRAYSDGRLFINSDFNITNTSTIATASITGTSSRLLLAEYDDDDWSLITADGEFYFKQETGNDERFNVRGADNNNRLQVDIEKNHTNVSNSLTVTGLASASCDVKAYSTNGTLYCGTDATGTGSGGDNSGWVNNSVFTDTNGVYVNYTEPSIYLGGNGVDEDKFIWFSEDGSDTGEYIAWNNTDDGFFISDRLRLLNDIIASGNIGTTEDIYTTGTGDNLWLGSSTEAGAQFTAYSNGDLNATGSISFQKLNTASCDVKAYSTNGTLYCGTDATGSGGASQFMNDTQNLSVNGYNIHTSEHFYQHKVPVVDYNAWFCDMMPYTTALGSCEPSYYGIVVGTAGATAVTVSPNGTYGTIALRRGTSTNSGYIYSTGASAFLLQGNETFSTLINLTFTTGTNISYTMLGFCDVGSYATSCTDGVWFNITGNTTHLKAWGTQRANGATSQTTTNYNLTNRELYIMSIRIINITTSNFSIYSFPNPTIVWSSLLNSNMPVSQGREVGAEIFYAETGAGTAVDRLIVDYILTEVENHRSKRFV